MRPLETSSTLREAREIALPAAIAESQSFFRKAAPSKPFAAAIFSGVLLQGVFEQFLIV